MGSRELLAFLKPFQEATLSLEQPTIRKVAFWRSSLLQHLTPVIDTVSNGDTELELIIDGCDSPSILALKEAVH